MPHDARQLARAVVANVQPATTSRPLASPPWKCGTSPHSARSSVDLPDPDTPASTQNEPSSIVSETSRSESAAAPA